MPLNRPPLMSQGQANDLYSYTAISTGLMFLAGGLAAGPAAIALGLYGVGDTANNRRERAVAAGAEGTIPAYFLLVGDSPNLANKGQSMSSVSRSAPLIN